MRKVWGMQLVSLALAIPLLAAPARADVIAKAEGGFVSRNMAVVTTPPAETWQALVAPAGWWNGAHTYSGDSANLWIDVQATGCFCEKLPLAKNAAEGSRAGSIEHMRVIYAQPGRILRMSGGLGPLQSEAVSATLTITLKPVAEGTRILWEYVAGGFMRYKTDEIAPLVDKVMGEQLGRLAARLGPANPAETPPPAPAPDDKADDTRDDKDSTPAIRAEPVVDR